jgi:hypothetical protein
MGDKTVMDLEYRNGREVVAADIVIGSAAQSRAKKVFYDLIETHISESLFVDKPVKIDLYKFAMYGCMGRKGILTGIETQHIGMINTSG